MSNSYHMFSYVYDTFMDNIPYQEWSSYLVHLFLKFNITNGTLVELGCGTCNMAIELHHAGYSILGIDNSTDMLSIAADKISAQSNITLLLQNMQDFELGMKVHGIYCVCDSLNYLLTSTEVLQTFKTVKKHLTPNGIFIFDIKTPFFYQEILGDQVFCDHQENCSYTWENSFFEEDMINQYDLTIFAKQKNESRFERFQEVHHQKAYELSEIVDLLNQSGLKYEIAYDAFTEEPPHNESERIYIIARNGD